MSGKEWYQEQLKKPEWLAKRAEILARDGYACVDCGKAGVTFNCHHLHYVKGMRPWEYPAYALVTVCRGCHEKRHLTKTLQHATHEDAEMWYLFADLEAERTEEALRGEERADRAAGGEGGGVEQRGPVLRTR